MGVHQLRFYDTSWTDHVSDGGVVAISPLAQPTLSAVPAMGHPTPFAAAPGAVAYSPYGAVGPAAYGGPALVRRVNAPGAVLALVGGVLMLLGPLFPWESVSASGIALAGGNVKGTSEGAGPVVLIAGIVAALLAVLVLTGTSGRRKAGIAILIVAAASLVFCFGNWAAISKDIDKAPTGVDANIGIGLIVAVIGCILAAIAGIGLLRRRA